jgi:hypothetical protein
MITAAAPRSIADILHVLDSEGAAFTYNVVKVPQLDNSGEGCEHCQMEDADVQAQAYAKDSQGRNVFVEACLPCLVPALLDAWAAEYSTITVEVEL